MSGQVRVEQTQLQMDLLTIVQTKAQMAILDTALFYILKIRKKLLEPMVEEAAPLDTEQTLQVVVKVAAQAMMLNILLTAER